MRIRIYLTICYLLISVPIGLWFLLYDEPPISFSILKQYRSFWISWASSTGVTFLGICTVDSVTRILQRFSPWNTNWQQRLWLQLGLGLLLPMALVIAWNALFFHEQQQINRLEDYFNAECWLVLILVSVFNPLCCLLVMLPWSGAESEDESDNIPLIPDTIPDPIIEETPVNTKIDQEDLIEHASYIEVTERTCTVYRMDGSKEYYNITMDVLAKEVEGVDLCRIHRKLMVNRKAIAEVQAELGKHVCFIVLKEPYPGKCLRAGPSFVKHVLKWWDPDKYD